jgi:hypothetical protein
MGRDRVTDRVRALRAPSAAPASCLISDVHDVLRLLPVNDVMRFVN